GPGWGSWRIIRGRGRLRKGAALHHRDEKPVRAVARGAEAQPIAPRRAIALDCLGPDGGDGKCGEIRMARKELVDLVLVLLTEQRAGRVDESPARLHQPLRAVEDLGL